jgi:uncharacterized protein YgiM (DUF1202 family)
LLIFSSKRSKELSIPENSHTATNTINGELKSSNSSVLLLGTEVKYWYVNTINLNLRQYPGANQPVLQTLPMNTRVVLVGEKRKLGVNTWVKVKTIDGTIQEGWVNEAFLRKLASVSN